MDLASAEAREYYRRNILATVKNMQLPGVLLRGIAMSKLDPKTGVN